MRLRVIVIRASDRFTDFVPRLVDRIGDLLIGFTQEVQLLDLIGIDNGTLLAAYEKRPQGSLPLDASLYY